MTSSSSVACSDPFLLRFATPRASGAEMPGRYSAVLDVWVLDCEGGEQPIIEVSAGSLAMTQTKTMQQVESDDDDPMRFGAMETGTYTKVRQESDDEDGSLCLPEITTKTDVQQERDDQASNPYW